MADSEDLNDDVMDQDLMKELGLTEEDVKATQAPGAAKTAARPASAPPARPSAPPPARPAGTTPPRPPVPQAQTTATKAAPPVPAATQRAQAGPDSRPIPKVDADDLSEHNNRVVQDVPVQLAVVMAKQSLRLKDILQLKVGDVMDFKKPANEPVDLVGNGKLVAKAELVMVDGKVGVRILKLVK